MIFCFSHLNKVNLELFSICNRKCPWCPNSFIKRDKVFLDKTVFIQLVQDLYNNNFALTHLGVFFIAGYSEPMLYPQILYDYIKIIREIFYDRQIKISINTNGDFLTSQILNELPLTENDEIGIMDYDCKGQKYWSNFLSEECDNIINNKKSIKSKHKNKKYAIKTKINWPKNNALEDRGNSLDTKKLNNYIWANDHKLRTQKCMMPQKYLQIYADGSVTFCCHFHPQNEQHKKYILGNLYNDSIINIYQNPILKKSTDDFLICKFDESCKYCQKGVESVYNINEKIHEYYKDIFPQYLKLFSQYIPFKFLQIKDIKQDMNFSKWRNDKVNPYFIDKNSKQLLLEDILKKGVYFPFILNSDYQILEGKHKYLCLKENGYDDFYVPCLIIPNTWNKYNKLSFEERTILSKNKNKILFPKQYKIPDISNLKEFKKYNEEFDILITNNLYLIYCIYQTFVVRLGYDLYYIPEAKAIDYKKEILNQN